MSDKIGQQPARELKETKKPAPLTSMSPPQAREEKRKRPSEEEQLLRIKRLPNWSLLAQKKSLQ